MINVIQGNFPTYGVPPKEWSGYSTAPESPKKPERKNCGGLFYFPRADIWKASNVSWNPKTEIALSYNWWIFVARIGGKLVFNSYSYSSSTARHQSKMRNFLRDQGIKIDLFIHAPDGLQKLETVIPFYLNAIKMLQAQIDKPRSRPETNRERRQIIAGHKITMQKVKDLIKAQIKAQKKYNRAFDRGQRAALS